MQRARQLLSQRFELPDLREGDTLLTTLWKELQQKLNRNDPPPPWLDFRMAGGD